MTRTRTLARAARPLTLVLLLGWTASCASRGPARDLPVDHGALGDPGAPALTGDPEADQVGEPAPPRARSVPATATAAPGAAASSSPADDATEAMKQANNPLANMKAFSVHNYFIRDVAGTDETANQFWLRYAQPFELGEGQWLMRASLPVNTVPTGGRDTSSGLGDMNVFATYLLETDDPNVNVGFGPLLVLPTATRDATGTDQWGLGAAAVFFDSTSKAFQYGGLVTYAHKIAGESRAPDLNLFTLQPFWFLQLGKGAYFRSSGVWSFDLESGNYAIPVGAGLGKAIKVGDTVFNLFVEPQFTVLQEGFGQPEFQVFFGFNTQFLGS